jgi:Na+/H+ antiporter NhaD/arsenite permease-like protein
MQTAAFIFLTTYIGVALGRIPGLTLDGTGIALLIKFLDPSRPDQWYALAVSSTFAGNLITIGCIANLIVIEQAAACGVNISFRDHARVGIPVTLASLAAWIGA